MTREFGLLSAVASWDCSTERDAWVRRAADGVDWARWLVLADAHRLLPHARRQLDSASVTLPSRMAEELESAVRDAAVRGLALSRQGEAVAAAFASAGVRALPFKGPWLARSAYGDFAARPSVDLDFVVPPGAVRAAVDALRAAGYQSTHQMTAAQERVVQASFGHFEYSRAGEVAKVELHTMFSSPRYPWTMPVEAVMTRAEWPVGGGAPTLDPVDDVLLQVMHGARHHWQPLEWLVAVAATSARRQVDPRELAARAARHRAARALRVAAGVGYQVLGAWPFGDSSIAPRGAAELEVTSVIAESIRAADAVQGIAHPTRADLAQFDSIGDRARYLLRSAVDPTLREWELIQLPDSLLPLYYPIRLARLALKPFVRR